MGDAYRAAAPRRTIFIEPCQPTLRDKPPTGPDWLHEVKFDGYRVQLHKVRDETLIYSRNGMDFTPRFPAIAAALSVMPARSVKLDGELVATNAKGMPDFSALHRRRASIEDLCVYAFDILELNGVDLRPLTLAKRRIKLARLLEKFDGVGIYLSEPFDDPETLLKICNEHRLEGIVSKRADRPYTSGPTKNWIKVKCQAWREANRERHKLFEK